MGNYQCPHCGKEQEEKSGAAFCPYCGGAVIREEARAEDPPEVRELLQQAGSMKDIRKKWHFLLQAEEKYPDSLPIAEELLFLGRLYDRDKRQLDFSVIKCYLFMAYLKPGEFSEERAAQFREEMFDHPQLLKCLALAPNRNAFLRQYLMRLCVEFIRLFLRGDSIYMRKLFGFGLDSRAPKLLADPVSYMLDNIRRDEHITSEQRDMLMTALYQAFDKDMGGDTQWLNQRLDKAGIKVPGRV
ncbi:MAG: hypothetical protein FWF86_06705 [Clostridia bacterium]|nr:hypothetical protein [Clostridia bacterium]